MALTHAQRQKKIRQDSLREWLSEKCTAQHLVDNLEKIEKLDPDSENFSNQLKKYQVANDQRLRIMNKYIPDLKAVELSGDPENPLETNGKWTVEFVNATPKDQS